MKRLIILIIFCAAHFSTAQNSPYNNLDEYGIKIIEFNEVYVIYVKKLFGCPIEATKVEECRPNNGIRDWKLEAQVVEKAKIFTKN